MVRYALEDLPKKLQTQALAQLEPKQVEPAVPTQSATKGEVKMEKELQATCEDWLTHRGYLRLTADNATRASKTRLATPPGWFGHLHKPKGNPFLPDLFLLGTDGRYLCIELKVVPKWQPGQLQMVDMKFWSVAWTFTEFENLIHKWEGARHEQEPR